MRFTGSRYFIEASGFDVIRSGCIEKPVDWWVQNIRRCAEENGYTLKQVNEYELYVKLLKQWFDVYGGDIKEVS